MIIFEHVLSNNTSKIVFYFIKIYILNYQTQYTQSMRNNEKQKVKNNGKGKIRPFFFFLWKFYDTISLIMYLIRTKNIELSAWFGKCLDPYDAFRLIYLVMPQNVKSMMMRSVSFSCM